MDDVLTLAELAETAAEMLGDDGGPAARVRPTPRTLRYYASQRLLDPPLELRGPHSAYYGRRHLLQVLAVKRLQAQGRSLNEIRAMLSGASETSLLAAAAVPEARLQAGLAAGGGADAVQMATAVGTPAAPPAVGTPAAPLPAQQRAAAFWRAKPDPVPASPAAPLDRPLLVGVPVGPVVVLLPATRPPDDADRLALASAAGPLLTTLEERGLLPPAEPPDPPATSHDRRRSAP